MNSFIHSLLHSAIKGLLRYIGGLVFILLLIAAVAWGMHRLSARPQWEADAAAARTPPPGWNPPAVPSQWVTPPLSPAEFQALIADVYHVESSTFVRPDLLRITLGADERDPQGKCQGIANVWSFRCGQPNVFVECWSGDKRLGFGVVQNGQLVNP